MARKRNPDFNEREKVAILVYLKSYHKLNQPPLCDKNKGETPADALDKLLEKRK